MKIIAFMNQKGGVGKTTTTVSIGSILASEYGKKVLLIDLDPQGNLSDHLGIDPNETEKSIYNVIIDGMNAREVLVKVGDLDVLPANIDLSGAEVELAGMMVRETRLKTGVQELCKDYDYVLIDCPPSLGLLTISGLTLAQEVIVPMQAEYLALRGLSQLLNSVELVRDNLNPVLDVTGVIFCMFDGRTNLARDVRDEVESHLPGRVYDASVRKNVRLAESPSHGLPINIYDFNCAGAVDYREITAEFLHRENDPSAPLLDEDERNEKDEAENNTIEQQLDKSSAQEANKRGEADLKNGNLNLEDNFSEDGSKEKKLSNKKVEVDSESEPEHMPNRHPIWKGDEMKEETKSSAVEEPAS